MLGKIIKYEFKATARIYLLLYCAFMLVTIINAVVTPNGVELINGHGHMPEILAIFYQIYFRFIMMLYFLLNGAVVIVTVVVTVVRFYRLLGDDGYLWFTLPAKINAHLLGKMVPSLVWAICSTLVMIVSVIITFVGYGYPEFIPNIIKGWQELVAAGMHPLLWLICTIVCLFGTWLSATLSYYSAMSIGPNFTKSRLGGSILAYIGLRLVYNLLSIPVTMIAALPLNRLMNMSIDYSDPVLFSQQMDQIALTLTLVFMIQFMLNAVINYLITYYMVNRKLNLA